MYNLNGEILPFAIEIFFYEVAKLLLPKFKGPFKCLWLQNQLIK